MTNKPTSDGGPQKMMKINGCNKDKRGLQKRRSRCTCQVRKCTGRGATNTVVTPAAVVDTRCQTCDLRRMPKPPSKCIATHRQGKPTGSPSPGESVSWEYPHIDRAQKGG